MVGRDLSFSNKSNEIIAIQAKAKLPGSQEQHADHEAAQLSYHKL